MKKMGLVLVFTLLMTGPALASEYQELQIKGCSFSTQTYYRATNGAPVSSTWLQGFDVEKRLGWGLPTEKISPSRFAHTAYLGRADLGGGTLEVLISTIGVGKLNVKVTLKQTTGNKVDVVATGTASSNTTYLDSGSTLFTSVEIENPLISSIFERDSSAHDPFGSALFPLDTKVLGGAIVDCWAEMKTVTIQ